MMLCVQTLGLVALMADQYEGKFLSVPRMMVDYLADEYGREKDRLMLTDPAGHAWRSEALSRLGTSGGEPFFFLLLHETPNTGAKISATVSLVTMRPSLRENRLEAPARQTDAYLAVLTVEEFSPDPSVIRGVTLQRSARLYLGPLTQGYELMQGSIDHYALVKQFQALAEVVREFPNTEKEVLIRAAAS